MTAVAFPHATAGVDSSRTHRSSQGSKEPHGGSRFDSLMNASDAKTPGAKAPDAAPAGSPTADPRASAHRAMGRQAGADDQATTAEAATPVPTPVSATDVTAALAVEPPPLVVPQPTAQGVPDAQPAVTVAVEAGVTADAIAPSDKPAKAVEAVEDTAGDSTAKPADAAPTPLPLMAMAPPPPPPPPPHMTMHSVSAHESAHADGEQPIAGSAAGGIAQAASAPAAAPIPAPHANAQQAASFAAATGDSAADAAVQAATGTKPTKPATETLPPGAIPGVFDTSATNPAPSVTPQAPTAAPAPTAETQRQVAIRIGKAAKTGEDTLTIELHPADLGHVAVRLAFHAGGVDVQMVVARKETYDAFMQDRAGMERQLSQAGIDLGSGGLNLQYGAPSDRPTPFLSGNGTGTGTPGEPVPDIVAHALRPGHGLVNIIA